MLGRGNWLILGLAVLAAGIGGIAEHRRQPALSMEDGTDSALIGHAVPALTLPDLDGKLHSLSDYRGQRLLLNFWASWCGPCLDEMPTLNQAQKKFGEKGAIVVGIAMDEPDRVRAFLAAHPVSYPMLVGQLASPSSSEKLGDEDQILPYSVLIDGDGRILATHRGSLSTSRLDRWLAPATGQR
ncbi:TlpA family protein disulfide reductase [Rhodanobacter ginsengisoli]|uniref:TlpA family protein disulfide reductase n=1 Tax=Rhodanobacter ginsengisoli TaxID=418646 RepID=A0ABW0QT38_9GAMM